MAAPEDRLTEWMQLAMRLEGVALCQESAACLGVLEQALQAGHLAPDGDYVVFNTGAVQKYVEVMQCELPRAPAAGLDPAAFPTR